MTETFAIIPAHIRGVWLFLLLLLPLVAILGAGGALVVSLLGARNARFEVSASGLRLRGDLYGRTISPASLELDQARPVDLTTDRDLQPIRRSVGTAMPGYRSGWFNLRNGQRALLYVTDPSRVAYVPTRDRYVVLLSVADPSALIASLRRVTPPR
jgi:PH (Pleckstrin Homology) domain-containing protein